MHRALLLAFTLALPGAAWSAQDCATEIHGTDQMTFDKSEIVVPASCKTFTVTLKHPGEMPREVMGHNWILSKTDDMQAILDQGSAAGVDNGYLQADDARIIAHTRFLGGGEQDSVTFDTAALKTGGPYQFFCSFPGHAALMKGVLKFGA